MATTIGVRQLKNEATRIVRSVREHGEEYIITVNGEPVAELRPLARDESGEAERTKRWLADIDELAREVSAATTTGETAVELVREQRR